MSEKRQNIIEDQKLVCDFSLLFLLRRLQSEKRIQNLKAKKSNLLRLKSRNFSET